MAEMSASNGNGTSGMFWRLLQAFTQVAVVSLVGVLWTHNARLAVIEQRATDERVKQSEQRLLSDADTGRMKDQLADHGRAIGIYGERIGRLEERTAASDQRAKEVAEAVEYLRRRAMATPTPP